jgi:Aerotolerance regulator N-terminal
MLSALAPALLGLGVATAIPLLIHLLTRKKTTTIFFPAAAFLQQREAGRSRKKRLKEIMILLLRTLSIAAMVAAGAGLLWHGLLAGQQQPAVIIIDASASMRQRLASGGTAFDQARALARQLTDQFSQRAVRVILATQPPTILGSETVAALPSEIASLLSNSQAGFGDGDHATVMNKAVALLPQGGDIFFLSDLARNSLSGIDRGMIPAAIHIHAIDVGGGGDNVAINAISSNPGTIIAGRSFSLTAHVMSVGTQLEKKEQHVQVTFRIGHSVYTQSVKITPGTTALATVQTTIDDIGWVPVEVTMTHDDVLPDDNRRYGQLFIAPSMPIILASDRDRDDPAGVVRPLWAAIKAAGWDVRHSDAVGLAQLDDHVIGNGLIITAGIENSIASETMAKHLQQGGTWLQILSSDADARLVLPGIEPPGQYSERIDVSDQERGIMTIGQARIDHPLLSGFQGRESMLTDMGAWRYRLSPRPPANDATVLLAYADGTLALTERPVGLGRWLQWNCSPALADGNLGRGEALPLILEQLPLRMLAQRKNNLSADAGRTQSVNSELIGPDQRSVANVGGVVRLSVPGIYRKTGGEIIAAAIPTLESDLRQIDPQALGFAQTNRDKVLTEAISTPLWSWLLSAALIMLCVEMALMGGVRKIAATQRKITA